MADPIRPEDVTARKTATVPGEVIEEFNELIAATWDGHQSVVGQAEVAAAIAERFGISRQEVFDRHLLDVEPVYRDAGWLVAYDKPGWNETYPARFIFTRKD